MDKPIPISDVQMAFPAGIVEKYMVPRDKIPSEYPNKAFFLDLQRRWFYSGLSDAELPAVKDGIDENQAWRHLGAIQRSFEPKHEHKQDCVAWLMSLWFQGPESVKPVEVKPVVKKPLSKGRQKRRRS